MDYELHLAGLEIETPSCHEPTRCEESGKRELE